MKRSSKVAEPARQRGPWPRGTTIEFFVAGHAPVGKGSMRAFVPKSWAAAAAAAGRAPRAVITDEKGKELRAYEGALRAAARIEMDRRALPCALRQPFEVIVGFFFARPDADHDKVGRVKPSARATPWVAPDIEKCARAAFDPLTGIVWDDDSRIVRTVVEKRYADAMTSVGTFVKIRLMPATVRELADLA